MFISINYANSLSKMRWSKLKKMVQENICASMRKRINFNSTRYGNCSCGHFWITLDKEVIANFCTRAFWNTNPQFDEVKGKFVKGEDIDSKKFDKLLVNYGDLSRQNAYESCWDYIHHLSLMDALKSDDPLIQTLAVLDSKLGKNQLSNLADDHLHPLAKFLLKERIKSDRAS